MRFFLDKVVLLMKQIKYSCWVLVCICAMLSFAANADNNPQTVNKTSEKRWTLNQHDADIREFIAQIAEITGDTFVIDPRIKNSNTVTVLSNTPMSKQQIYDVFLEVLSANGYAVIPKGNAKSIVPVTVAKSAGNLDKSERYENATLVTRVIFLSSVSAIEIIPIIRPLIAQHGHAAASVTGNSVVVSDFSDNVDRIVRLIKELDDAGDSDYDVIALEHAWVGDISRIVQETMASNNKGQFPSGVQIVADEVSNRLVIKGNASKRNQVKNLVKTLDHKGVRTSSTRVMFLRYADAKNLAELLSEASQTIANSDPSGAAASVSGNLPRPRPAMPTPSKSTGGFKHGGNIFIKADETTNALVMIADPNTLNELESLVRQLDVRRAQVLVEAAIVEISGDINDALGIQWGFTGNNTYSNNNTNNTTSPTAASVLGAALPNVNIGSIALRNSNFGVLVNALTTRRKTNLLSTPSMITLDNEEAEFIVGQEVPFQTGSYTQGGTSNTNPFTTTERKPVGLTLKVTPHIGDGESLRLEIEQEVSNLIDNTSSVTASADPITSQRKIKATIIADNGETIILGGLLQDDVQKSNSKVPFFSDIPVIGWFFTNSSDRRTKRNLMLFIKPSIMRSSGDISQMTRKKYSTLKLLQRELIDNNKKDEYPDEIGEFFDRSDKHKNQ